LSDRPGEDPRCSQDRTAETGDHRDRVLDLHEQLADGHELETLAALGCGTQDRLGDRVDIEVEQLVAQVTSELVDGLGVRIGLEELDLEFRAHRVHLGLPRPGRPDALLRLDTEVRVRQLE